DEKVSTGNGQSETINRRQKTEMLDHIVLEVNRKTKQIISEKKEKGVFGMCVGLYDDIILGVKNTPSQGSIQFYSR
ncbi:unnamed protein product, partial [Didymodactylos carnosus]